MRTLGNIIWHIPFLGFVIAFWAFLLGSLLVLTVIASPIGLGLLEYAKFLLKPFASEVTTAIKRRKASEKYLRD